MKVFVLTLCLAAVGVFLIGDCRAESEGYLRPDFCPKEIFDQDCRAVVVDPVCTKGRSFDNHCLMCQTIERDHLNVESYTTGKCP